MVEKNSPLLNLKTIEELRSFPVSTLDKELPWNYRVSGGCAGLILRPFLCLTGDSHYLKHLTDGQKDELRELMNIIGSEEKWNQLRPLEQLDVRIRATKLTDQYSASRMLSFRK